MATIYFPNITFVKRMWVVTGSGDPYLSGAINTADRDYRSYSQLNDGVKEKDTQLENRIPFTVTVPDADEIRFKGTFTYNSDGDTTATWRKNNWIEIPKSVTGKSEVKLITLSTEEATSHTTDFDEDITSLIKNYKGQTITLNIYLDFSLKHNGIETHTYTFSGEAEKKHLIHYWNGSQWVEGELKYWNGTEWVDGAELKYWNGNEWVEVE